MVGDGARAMTTEPDGVGGLTPEPEPQPEPAGLPGVPDGVELGPVTLVRGRLVATATALLGLLLAVPLVFWPTHTMSVVSLGTPVSPPDFRQSYWSWGRYVDTTIAGEPQFDYANHVALAFFLLALVVGVGATVAYALRPGLDAVVVAAAGLGWVAVAVAGPLATRVGDVVGGLYGNDERVVVTVELAGWFQTASAAFLFLALGVVVARPFLALARDPWRAASVWVRTLRPERPVNDSSGADAATSTPRVGIATLRDAPRRDPGTPSGAVGFTDVDPEDERFQPPR